MAHHINTGVKYKCSPEERGKLEKKIKLLACHCHFYRSVNEDILGDQFEVSEALMNGKVVIKPIGSDLPQMYIYSPGRGSNVYLEVTRDCKYLINIRLGNVLDPVPKEIDPSGKVEYLVHLHPDPTFEPKEKQPGE